MKRSKVLSLACATFLCASSASAGPVSIFVKMSKYSAGAYIVNFVLNSGKGFVEGLDNKKISEVFEDGKTFLSWAPDKAEKFSKIFGQTVKNFYKKNKNEWKAFKKKRGKEAAE